MNRKFSLVAAIMLVHAVSTVSAQDGVFESFVPQTPAATDQATSPAKVAPGLFNPQVEVELKTTSQPSAPQAMNNAAVFAPAPGRTASRPVSQVTPESKAILRCSDINVAATSAAGGELKYSFTCDGPFELVMGATRLHGQSVSLVDGRLVAESVTISTAGGATFTAKELELHIPIVGVQIRKVPAPPSPVFEESPAFFSAGVQ